VLIVQNLDAHAVWGYGPGWRMLLLPSRSEYKLRVFEYARTLYIHANLIMACLKQCKELL
jgi:hypothetical protein